jgi:hypothetical protein
MRASFAALALAAACTGPQSQLTKLTPELVVAPDELVFGDVIIEQTAELELLLVNSGRADLEITALSFSSPDFTADVSALVLEPDASAPVQVTFRPSSVADLSGELAIVGNLPDGDFLVPIAAQGVPVPTCELQLSRDAVDFATVAVDAEPLVDFVVLTNAGGADCALTDFKMQGSGAFQILSPADFGGGLVISADSSENLVIQYDPYAESGDAAVLSFATNDPALPGVSISLSGNGGAGLEYPEAVIDCPDGVFPPTVAVLDGSASTDPEGLALTYAWRVVERPDGASGDLDDRSAPAPSLEVDVAGDWEVQLQVTNELGVLSAPAACRFEAVPENLLHIELVWDSADADLDLHLAEQGYAMFESPGDCNWCNESPDWGSAGTSDDPLLQQDADLSTGGLGPENIVIPEPASGNYEVRVHYFQDGGAGTTTATVRVWANGRLVEELEQDLVHNQQWDAGYLRWPDGLFVPSDTPPTTAVLRTCTP